MADREEEIPLAGGNVNAGVVRVGDTVRRRTDRQSPSVHRLLRHLEAQGFRAAPRFLGIDDAGREMLSYLPGETDFPRHLWTSDRALLAAAEMLRGFQAALASFARDEADHWAYCYPDASRCDTLCHNDFAPYNMVFADGVPVGILDFDLAGPGPALRDTAYLAYWLAPLSFASDDLAVHAWRELAEGCPRLRMLCDILGVRTGGALLDMVSEVLHHMGSADAAAAMIGAEAARKLGDGGHFAHWQREAEAFDEMRDAVAAALGR